MGIPALTKSMNEGGREGITGAHRVGNCDVVPGSPGEFAIFENRAAAFAEGDTHGFEGKPGGPAPAEVFDGVAWPLRGVYGAVKRFGLKVAELDDVAQRAKLFHRSQAPMALAQINVVKAARLRNR